MCRQGLQGRRPKHRKGLTRQDAKAPKFPDLVHRDFTAMAPNVRWCGDVTEIPTDEGKLYRHRAGLVLPQTVGLPHQRASGCRAGVRRDQDRYSGARWPRRGRRGRVSHRPRIDLHRKEFHRPVRASRGTPVDGPGRVDNAAAEAFFSTLEHEVLSRHHFATRAQARAVVVAWCLDFYNTRWGIAPPDCGHQ
jgi:hypothetical protein